MSWEYSISKGIDLFVKGRIAKQDAKRQNRTAKEILRRLHNQPGLILADEVGMGKTFVALAVATSVYLEDKKHRPVVVMVPSSLKEKWPRDYTLFRERAVQGTINQSLDYGKAEKAEQFLKFLDDPPERRKAIIFLTHGAMSRGLRDGWIKLALIQRALHRRWNTEKIKKALYRSLGQILNMRWAERHRESIWEELLNKHPEKWLIHLQRVGIDPENDQNPDTDDDPVPEAIIKVFSEIDLSEVYEAIKLIPYIRSKHYDKRVKAATKIIDENLRIIWEKLLKNLKEELPLLILDEAHHLKNARTILASLFSTEEAKDDASLIEQEGPLAGMFERMLFLTATPFQLGHAELCNVLDRFAGIRWNSFSTNGSSLYQYQKEILKLRTLLDSAQLRSLALDHAWDRLKNDDIVCGERQFENIEEWWTAIRSSSDNLTSNTNLVLDKFSSTEKAMKKAERTLKKWVIRHNKSKYLPNSSDTKRRARLVGQSIISNEFSESDNPSGLAVEDEVLLPFLLSARLTAVTPESRPVFAEGLVSSYEAFMQTRMIRQSKEMKNLTDMDDDSCVLPTSGMDERSHWYLNELISLLPSKKRRATIDHPKVKATVDRAIQLWLDREKVLIFCHYVSTGQALRNYISEAIKKEILVKGAERLDCRQSQVFDELEKVGQRFSSDQYPLRRAIDEILNQMVSKYPKINRSEYREELIDSIRRYLRTPSFLIRFFPLRKKRMSKEMFLKAFSKADQSGMTLDKLINSFLDFLENRCEENERIDYIQALNKIQPGGIRGKEVESTFSEDEKEQHSKGIILQPNVRLVNGSTKQATRQKLMLTFNTPFYPDILVASSVMAEGVDLHLNCRYIIHHDLCWNPSTLEQRTGRIDRIGAKAEQSSAPIQIYIPYIAETQDEKMYRVVMDRERWFKVVMGEKYSLDAKTTEKLANRIPIPLSLAEELSFKLGL